MKNKLIPLVILLFSFLGQLYSCHKEPPPVIESHILTPYALKIPEGFPAMNINQDNPLTNEGVALGRRLYYDTLLSNNGRSCSGCHFQKDGFTTAGSTVLPHVNLGWNSSFLWNGKIEGRLEDIMLFEVELFFATDHAKLNNHAEYPGLFKKAFGVTTITSKETSYALAQFFRVLISGNSRYDRAMRKELFLNDDEVDGYQIFFSEKGDCFHCHNAPLFTDNKFHNVGLDSVFNAGNSGRFEISGVTADMGKYKTPTLRNVSLRNSYMHDGRFTTLEEAVDHYNSGVKRSSTLDPILTKPGKENGLKLSSAEKAALVAFLKTLTDSTFITNTNLSRP